MIGDLFRAGPNWRPAYDAYTHERIGAWGRYDRALALAAGDEAAEAAALAELNRELEVAAQTAHAAGVPCGATGEAAHG